MGSEMCIRDRGKDLVVCFFETSLTSLSPELEPDDLDLSDPELDRDLDRLVRLDRFELHEDPECLLLLDWWECLLQLLVCECLVL